MNKLQVVIIVFCVVIAITGVIVFSQRAPEGTSGPASELSVWGTEPGAIFQTAFESYNNTFNVKIEYSQKDSKTFSETIVNALAEGGGPDLVIADSAWVLVHKEKIAPATLAIANLKNLSSSFIDSASNAFFRETVDETTKKGVGVVWAMPLWVDPLVLFWNKDIFNASSIALPPKNWFEFLDVSNRTKILAAGGAVTRAGAALGRASTIPLYKELVALLAAQQEVSIDTILTQQNTQVESALRFYIDFGRFGSTAYTWNNALKNPRDLFAAGKLSMMVDYISFVPLLAEKNAHLSYAIAKAPQTGPDREFPVYTANIKGITVLRGSKKQDAAWTFARWLAGPEPITTIVSRYPIAPAQRSLLNDKNLSPIIKESVLNTRYVSDNRPKDSSFILGELIESVADGRSTLSEALSEARAKYAGIR